MPMLTVCGPQEPLTQYCPAPSLAAHQQGQAGWSNINEPNKTVAHRIRIRIRIRIIYSVT